MAKMTAADAEKRTALPDEEDCGGEWMQGTRARGSDGISSLDAGALWTTEERRGEGAVDQGTVETR